MNSDVWTRLAELLKRAAGKWPEKFILADGDGNVVSNLNRIDLKDAWMLRLWNGWDYLLFDVNLDMLSSPSVFTLDHMDAIAEAVGCWFEVYATWHYINDDDRVRDGYGYSVYHNNDVMPADYAEVIEKTKRLASAEALCAILTLKLEEQ